MLVNALLNELFNVFLNELFNVFPNLFHVKV